MDPAAILFEERDSIATLTLNRPERRNPLSRQLMLELRDRSARSARARPAAWCWRRTGRCSPPATTTRTWWTATSRDARAARGLHRADERDPVDPATGDRARARPRDRRGLPAGRGCDLAIASDDAQFATPGGARRLFCTTPMVSVSRAVGRKRALEMLFTGDAIDAPTAADWGLINRVVPADQLVAATDALSGGRRAAAVLEGPRQAGLLRADRSRPAQGLRLRGRGDGVGRRRRGRSGGHQRLPREAPPALYGLAASEARLPVCARLRLAARFACDPDVIRALARSGGTRASRSGR